MLFIEVPALAHARADAVQRRTNALLPIGEELGLREAFGRDAVADVDLHHARAPTEVAARALRVVGAAITRADVDVVGERALVEPDREHEDRRPRATFRPGVDRLDVGIVDDAEDVLRDRREARGLLGRRLFVARERVRVRGRRVGRHEREDQRRASSRRSGSMGLPRREGRRERRGSPRAGDGSLPPMASPARGEAKRLFDRAPARSLS